MDLKNWRKIENEAGYSCYVNKFSSKQQYDHPEFGILLESLEQYNCIKDETYQLAFKLHELQKQLQVPGWLVWEGVAAAHGVSTAVTLDAVALDALVHDAYFAAAAEVAGSGGGGGGCGEHCPRRADLLLNLLLHVYDRGRQAGVPALAALVSVAALSGGGARAVAAAAADHNAVVSRRRLAAALTHLAALGLELTHPIPAPATTAAISAAAVQQDVDACFAECGGMAGLSVPAAAHGMSAAAAAGYVTALGRVMAARSRRPPATALCTKCRRPLHTMVVFWCGQCGGAVCETCQLCDVITSNTHRGHTAAHIVTDHEPTDTQSKPVARGLIRTVRRLLCTKRRRHKPLATATVTATAPAPATSTVREAAGARRGATAAAAMLADIVAQLDAHTRALQDAGDEEARALAAHVATQVDRLRALQLSMSGESSRPHAFDVFSPIAAPPPRPSAPRARSLDSGNFSSGSPPAPPPHPDSISSVSMGDISGWYHESAVAGVTGVTGVVDAALERLAAARLDTALDERACSFGSLRARTAELETLLAAAVTRLECTQPQPQPAGPHTSHTVL